MEININITYTLKRLCQKLNITQNELANKLGVSTNQISSYINIHSNPKKEVISKIIGIIDINELNPYELIDIEDEENSFFHGSKTNGIDGIITIYKSSDNIDFGNGFYLSDSFKNALSYVIGKKIPTVYRFCKNEVVVKRKYSFYNANNAFDWSLFIGLNRGKITNENDEMFFQNYYDKKFKNIDMIIGEIADSYNFEIMDLFFDNKVDANELDHALKKAKIGTQYVIKNEEIANSLKWVDVYKVEHNFKEYLIEINRKRKETLKTYSEAYKSIYSSDPEYCFDKIKEKMKNEAK